MAKDVIPLKVQAGSGLTFPWREFVSNKGSTADSSWGYGDSQVAMVMDIYFADLATAVQQLVGYSYVNQNDPSLHRVLPWAHPVWNWMRVSRIAKVQYLGFQGLYNNPGAPFFGANYGSGPMGKYLYARLTLLFRNENWTYLDDNTLKNGYGNLEWWRFVEQTPAGGVQYLTRGTGDFKWAETSPTGPVVGQGIGQGLSLITPKPSFVWKWVGVSEAFIMDAKGYPGQILSREGSVNSAPFPPYNNVFQSPAAQFPANTLLLLPSTKFTPRMAPVPPGVAAVLTNQPPRLWDVEFHVSYFDPPAGVNGTHPGHQGAPSPTDNLYYKVQTSPTPASPYPSTDFSKIFAMIGT